jgi:hypothetical protein
MDCEKSQEFSWSAGQLVSWSAKPAKTLEPATCNLKPEYRDMKIGMLWFDNRKKTALAEKITQAAQYYHQKYGEMPNCCHVHPAMLAGGVEVPGMEVRAAEYIMKNHLWIGTEDRRRGAGDGGPKQLELL